MARSSRTKDAARRASFGRAERLQRDGAAPPAKPDPSRTPVTRPARVLKPATPEASRPDRPAHQRHQLTPLHRAQERQERADAAADRRHLQRLQEQTRSTFNRDAERRRDTAGRAEHGRNREAEQKIIRRIEDHRRRATQRQAEQRREQTRRDFNQKADRRQDAERRATRDRLAANEREGQRQKAVQIADMQRRATVQIEQEQKRQVQEQQGAHRRMTDAMRTRHGIERHGFGDAKAMADTRFHHAIGNSYERQDRELAEFDGRRKGLAGRVSELLARTGAKNDREREAIVQRHEKERRIANLDYEALKERQFTLEQTRRLDRLHEQKALFELIRDERTRTGRDQAAERPRLIEERGRVIERADRAHEQERERDAPQRDNVRPSADFARAATESRETTPPRAPVPEAGNDPSTARDHAANQAGSNREAARYIPAERVLERA